MSEFESPARSAHPSEDSEALLSSQGIPLPNPSPAGVTSPEAEAADRRWYAVYTTCRHEKRVAQHLAQREVEHYLPLYTAQRKWRDGSKVALELPLFPCYIFVRIGRMERVRVLSTPGALAIVGGTGGEPAPLAEAAVEALRQGARDGRVEPHPLLTAGQQVRIRAGAFAGMRGIVSRKKSGFRVVLTIEQIMQSVAVEIDEADLELLTAAERDTRFAGRLHLQHA